MQHILTEGRNKAKITSVMLALLALVMVLGAVFWTSRATAAINQQINFQGKIVLASGSTNISNGTYNMQFKIYSGGDGAVGGGDETLLWTEDHLQSASNGVAITDGIFQVSLGSVTSLAGVDFNNSTLWLSINLGNTNASCTPFASCSGDGEMDPMVRFTASPYSLNSDLLDGLDSSAFGQLSQNQTWTGTQTFQPTTDITSAIVKQTTAGSPTADIFNVQTADSSNILQVTGPAANEAAVTLSSIGATRDLTLDSGSGSIVLGTTTTELFKSGTAFSFDLNNGSNSTFNVTNSGTGVASLVVEGDVSTTATINANAFDRTTSGALAVGNTNATSLSLCNSAACDAVTIASNSDADTVTIGDNLDTVGINGTTTITGDTNINISGSANTTIGNSSGGTITVGASSGSDLALNDAQWSVTGAGVANFASVNSGSGAITTSGTIGTAGTTTFTGGSATFAGGVNINATGTGNTTIGNSAGGTITIGAGSGSDLALQDAQWAVTGAGAASFASVNAGSGTIQTTGSVLGNTIDRTAVGTLNIGTTTATSVVIGSTSSTLTLQGDTSGVLVKPSDGTTALQVQRSSNSDVVIAADTSNNRVVIGNSSASSGADTTLLVVDSATNSNVPTGVNGGIYYDTTLNKFRCYEASNWKDCSEGSGPLVAQMYDSTGGTDINTGTPTAVPWDSETRKDNGITHDNVTNNTRVILDSPGWYKISYQVSGANQSASRNNVFCQLRFNGSTFNSPSGSYSYGRDTTNAYTTNTSTVLVQTNSANEYYEVTCSQAGSSGGQLAIANQSWTTVELIKVDNGLTLQAGYNNASTITTTDNRDLTINLAENTTDSSFVVNMQCATCSASGGRFAVQDNGTDIFSVNPNGNIAIGLSSGTDVSIQDAQWGVSGVGAATFASVNSGSGTIQTTGSVLGNSFGRTTTGTLAIGNTNASDVSICNSANCDTVNIATNTDADTINLGDNNDTINLGGQITGAGLTSCNSGNGRVTYNSSTSQFGCSSIITHSFVDTTADAVVDSNTTNYWDNSGANGNMHPYIVPTSASSDVFGIATVEFTQTSGTGDLFIGSRLERNNDTDTTYDTGHNPTCNSSVQVGAQPGVFMSNSGHAAATSVSFIDNPATTNGVVYTLCSDTSTQGTTGQVTRIRFTLFELNNAADLAEVYPTNDLTLSPAEVVSLDPLLPNGVERSKKANDRSVLGVVSTNPAMVIGGTDGLGANGVAIALSGRVPVKVTSENGPIKRGEILTASSTPGAAMKATKAGGMLGIAMEDFVGDGQGVITMYVKTGDYNGANLKEIMEADGYNSTVEGFNISALNYFLDKNSSIEEEATLDISEIFTDRVAAGLEIITPTITADKISTNTIAASTGQDLNLSLADDGRLLVSGPGGSQAFYVSSSGEASLAGSLSAGLDLRAGGSIFATGGLTVGADIDVGGQSIFRQVAQFFDKTIFRRETSFEGRASFNNDSGGFAVIHESQDEIKVEFDKPFTLPPVVIVNIKNGLFVPYSYTDLTEEGFTIKLSELAQQDIEFAWSATDIINPRTSEVPLTPPDTGL